MDQIITVQSVLHIEQDCSFHTLIIEEGAVLTAPEGKAIVFLVNGVGTEPLPGTYHDVNIHLITPMICTIPTTDVHYTLQGGLFVDKDGIIAESSALDMLTGGEITDDHARGFRLSSQDPWHSGIYIKDRKYEISDAELDLRGDVHGAFRSFRTGIATAGKCDVTINRCKIHTQGTQNSAFETNDNSHVVLNDCIIASENGILPEDYQPSILSGKMLAVPWMLGLRGNCRTTNVCGFSKVDYNRCHITAEGWGVASTDGVLSVELNARESVFEITGESGYGAYSIGDCVDTFEHCRISVPDIGIIIANGFAGAKVYSSTVDSDRFGIMWHGNMGGVTEIADKSCVHTGETTFLIKGCGPKIIVDHSELISDNGILLQMMNSDDTGDPLKPFTEENIVPDTLNPTHSTTEFVQTKDTRIYLKNMCTKGDMYNSTSGHGQKVDPEMQKSMHLYTEFISIFQQEDSPYHDMDMMTAYEQFMNEHGIKVLKPEDFEDGNDGEKPKMLEPSPEGANLWVELANAEITGAISASTAVHRVARIDSTNCEELGEVINTIGPVINNGVNVKLCDHSKWIVTKPSYLSMLEIDESCILEGKLYVNDEEVQEVFGQHIGNICVIPM